MAASEGLTWEKGSNGWNREYFELATKYKMPALAAQFLSAFTKEVLMRPAALSEVNLDIPSQHAVLLEISKLNLINFVREYRAYYSPDVGSIEKILREAWK